MALRRYQRDCIVCVMHSINAVCSPAWICEPAVIFLRLDAADYRRLYYFRRNGKTVVL